MTVPDTRQVVIVLAVALTLAGLRARPERRVRDLALGLGAGVVALLVADVLWWLVLAG
jgi:hypothetical protein